MQDDPDWMFDPHTRPTAPCPPGLMWSFGGNPMKWFHAERTAENVAAAAAAAPVVAPVPERTPFIETQAGIAMITGALSALTAVVTKVMDKGPPPPDPMTALAALMAAMNGNKGDPRELKELEIAAEEKRAAAALATENARIERENAARAEAARLAKEQRDHEVTMERERIAAAERAAIAAAAAADAREDKMLNRRLNGLIPKEGPTPEQAAAEKQLAVMSAQIEWMRNTPKTPDVMESFDKAKTLLTKLGVKVGESEDGAGSLIEALGTPAATAMATGIAPGLNAILMKLSGASPEAQPPMQTTVGVTLSAEELARREQLAYETGIRRAREAMETEQRAALAAQPPTPSLMDWQAVPAPVAEQSISAESAEQPTHAPEPVAEAPVVVVEEQPPPSPEAPDEAVEAPSEPASEPAAEPAPETPPVVTEAPADVDAPAEPDASEVDAGDVVDG